MSELLSTARETAKFLPEHVFFSRTDDRGIIQSANSVFQIVSEFSWTEIIGASHKIVRHPAMPRAVFRLLWSRITAGKPVGIYVVNRTKGGDAYAVLAVSMPFEDGYVSVRLKPMSDQVDEIKALYDDIARQEAAEGLDPEESLRRLLSRIEEMGFSDYDAFMADAIEHELLVRVSHLQKLKPHEVVTLSAIQAAVETIAAAGRDLDALLLQTNQIPDNMRLQAMRLEGRDGPIGVISANYQMMTETFTQSLKDFLAAAESAVAPVREAKFLAATGILVSEVARQLRTETGIRPEKKAADLQALERLATLYEEKAAQAVKDVARRAEYFDRISKDMRRMVFGLEMTRTMCNIERSKSSSDTDALDGVVERLHSAETQLSDLMTDVEGAVHDIMDRAGNLLRSRKDRRPPVNIRTVAAE
ncbi:PAS domain-containing protein [uncultured Tateyamaria sp.]|uniref:PAS domain-containing protein n=1 Tax=Tateyamaria sp. 1078 TaxID=3417464 RepID=UPI002620B2D4|nr:PAS domain-containing protein [uncultured Tateyamaria sp.]